MRRTLRPEEARLWAVIAATVRPVLDRMPPAPQAAVASPKPQATKPQATKPRATKTAAAKPSGAPPPYAPSRDRASPRQAPGAIEPGRRRRIARERDPLDARLDLHGLDQDRARERLTAFLLDAHARDARAVLVITGKGVASQGVLRRRAPEWLSDPRLRDVIAGVAPAEHRHGGDGAIYIALKRNGR